MERTTVHDLLNEARSHLRRLEPSEALDAVNGGALLIDVRSDDQRANAGSIPGALPIPLSVLEWRVDPESGHQDPAVGEDLDRQVILICAQGFSSSLAARRLQELGFTNATDVIGGFEAWRSAGLPVHL
ncbi:MAG TPA: rhodanese-like domain-containing protein [Actinomycetota bacterium]|nr:rhodanese-like domain-containing protein [Actinomycetota bacterium]